MKRCNAPTVNYELAPIASVLGKYNAPIFSGHHDTLNEVLEVALLNIESSEKPPVPHTSEQLVKTVHTFVSVDLMKLMGRVHQFVSPKLKKRFLEVALRYLFRLDSINASNQPEWLCDSCEIEEMFGISLANSDVTDIIDFENRKWSEYKSPARCRALMNTVLNEEIRNIADVVREHVIGVITKSPHLYKDKGDRHYLFWNTCNDKQECVVPESYSLGSYLRFHTPHNDTHLAHLGAINELNPDYVYYDQMDERAYTEAVAVLSEFKMFQIATDDEFIYQLYEQLSTARKKQLSQNEFQDWLIACRGYEFRLRLARLLGDFLTITQSCDLDTTVNAVVKTIGLPYETAKAEVLKYFHFTGLGACYTLGYLMLLEMNGNDLKKSFCLDEAPISTWHNFHKK